jgi:hypothetical protein
VEGIVEPFALDEIAQSAPGVADEAGPILGLIERRKFRISWSSTSPAKNSSRTRSYSLAGSLRSSSRSASVPPRDLTERGTNGGTVHPAAEYHFVDVIVVHAKSFGEMLARRLVFRAEDDPAQIKEDSLDAHLPFFAEAFVCVAFFCFAGFSFAGFHSGLSFAGAWFALPARVLCCAGLDSSFGADSASGLEEAPPAAGLPSSPSPTP